MAFKPNQFKKNTEDQIKKVENCLDYLVENKHFTKEGNRIIVKLLEAAVNSFHVGTPLSKEVIEGVKSLYQKAGWAEVRYTPPSKKFTQDQEVYGEEPAAFIFFEEDPLEGRNRV